MPTPSPWTALHRLLAIRLDNLGDVLMTTPALRALRDSSPNRHITLLASPASAALAPFVPEIDATMVVEGSPWLPGAAAGPEAMMATVERLRQGGFEAAVIFTVYSQNPLPAALLCWLAGIPRVLAHCRENPYHLLSDWVPEPEPQEIVRHEVRRQLDLVATVGAFTSNEQLSFRLRPVDEMAAAAKLRQAGVDPAQRWVVVHPGASAASRRYPAELFSVVADRLSERDELQLVFVGNADEIGLVDSIRGSLHRPLASLAGKLSLGELAAVIGSAELLVANNSGPVHIAAALGTPVVDIYALTNPQHAPWRVANRVVYHDVPCRFCYRSVCPQGHHACLRQLDPQKVAEAARQLLDGGVDRAVVAPG